MSLPWVSSTTTARSDGKLSRPSDRECRDALEIERYDLRSDPFELENLGEDSALAARLDTLRDCAGISGRDRPVSGASFCE